MTAGALDPNDLMGKAHLRAEREQLTAHVLQDGIQLIRADVRLGVEQNIFARAETDEFLQNKAVPQVFGAGRELAVGKCAGAALAELHVRDRVQLAGLPEMPDIAPALLDTAAALEHDRLCAAAGKDQ